MISLKTGKENRLQFKEAALDFALSSGMIEEIKTTNFTLPQNAQQIAKLENMENILVSMNNEGITVPPENGFKLNLPSQVTDAMQISFTVATKNVPDITITESQQFMDPTLPSPGIMSFKGIILQNTKTDTTLPPAPKFEPREPVSSSNAIYIQLKSGEEIELAPLSASEKPQEFSFLMKDYENVENIVINANVRQKLAHIVSVTFIGVDGESLLTKLDMNGIAVSTGAASLSDNLSVSHVLKAIGLINDNAKATVRFSFGKNNSYEEIDKAISVIAHAVEQLREFSSTYGMKIRKRKGDK